MVKVNFRINLIVCDFSEIVRQVGCSSQRIETEESTEEKNQYLRIYSREIDGVAYEGIAKICTGNFEFTGTDEPLNKVKIFKFYHNPDNSEEGYLTADIVFTTMSGKEVELVYMGDLTKI